MIKIDKFRTYEYEHQGRAPRAFFCQNRNQLIHYNFGKKTHEEPAPGIRIHISEAPNPWVLTQTLLQPKTGTTYSNIRTNLSFWGKNPCLVECPIFGFFLCEKIKIIVYFLDLKPLIINICT